MTSQTKSPSSENLAINSKEDLAKLHFVQNLFGQATGEDPYLIQNIKEAIELSLKEEESLDESIDTFAEVAMRLFRDQPFLDASYGFFHLDLSKRGFDPLFIREELVAGFKKVSGFDNCLILVTGLRRAICPDGRRFTQRLRAKYDDAIAYIDEMALKWRTENSDLSILYL